MNQGYNYNMYNNYNMNQNFNFNKKKKSDKLLTGIIIFFSTLFTLAVAILLIFFVKCIYDIDINRVDMASIPTENDVKEYIKENFSENNTIISKKKFKKDRKEEYETEEGYKYTVKSDLGFEFEVTAGIAYVNSSVFGGKTYYQVYYNNFFTNFEKNKNNVLSTLINKNSTYKITYAIRDKLSIEIDLMNNADNIDSSCDDLYRIKNELKEKYNILDQDIDIKFILDKDNVNSNFKDIYKCDKESYVEFIKRKFKNTNSNLNFNFANPTYIDKLFINNRKYDMKNTKFVYHPYHKEYFVLFINKYGPIHFNSISEIITKDYLYGSYEEQKNDDNNKFTINIGNNKYEAYFSFKKDKFNISYGSEIYVLGNNYYFKKNDENMNVEIISMPFDDSVYYIKVSDWASLLNCNYEIKDDAIYLTSK